MLPALLTKIGNIALADGMHTALVLIEGVHFNRRIQTKGEQVTFVMKLIMCAIKLHNTSYSQTIRY